MFLFLKTSSQIFLWRPSIVESFKNMTGIQLNLNLLTISLQTSQMLMSFACRVPTCV